MSRRWGFSTSDIRVITAWFQKFLVKWGVDKTHREEMLGKKVGSKTASGTFDHALKALTLHLVQEAASPVLDFTDVDLLETFLSFLQKLYQDLSKKRVSVSELGEILENHFLFLGEDKAFTERVKREGKALELIEKKQFSFEELEEYFLAVFTKKTASYHAKDLGNVPFVSLSMGISFPAKHIFLLGAEEGNFPRAFKKRADRFISRACGSTSLPSP